MPVTRNGPAVVAVLNTSPDVVDMLRHVFEAAGYVVVSLLTYQVRDGQVELESFLHQHQPDVVVYDIAPPYEPNWRLFRHIAATPSMRHREIVLTSTNPGRVRQLVDTTQPIYEIIGKPFDLDEIVNAVREAAHARPVHD